jgi:Rieske Fe-S protein
MAGGLVAGYGTCAVIGAKYVYPNASKRVRMFVTELAGMAKGESMNSQTPAGAKVAITRHGEAGTADDFMALSSTCPHLGCQVHWQASEERFFCPCHNGAFDLKGNPTEGPPKAANQKLIQYPLVVDAGLLYIELSEKDLA